MPTLRSLPDLFRERVAATPQGEAYRQYDRDAGRWQAVTWAETSLRVGQWMRALAGEQLAPGARVAILCKGCIEHVCMDQAALALGCVPVPLHAIDNAGSIAYILGDCGAEVLMVEQAKRWTELAPLRAQFPKLKKIVSLDHSSSSDVVWAEDWLKAATGSPSP